MGRTTNWGAPPAWVLLLAAGGAAPAAEDAALDVVRADFHALVRRIAWGPQPVSDSPTALLHRLLAAAPDTLRTVEEEAWRDVLGRHERDATLFCATEYVIELLHGHVQPNEADGILRFQEEEGLPSCGTGLDRRLANAPRTVEKLVKGAPLRASSKVDFAGAIARFPKLHPVYTPTDEDEDASRAIGEASADHPQGLDALVRLAADAAHAPYAYLALGWNGSREAWQALERELPRVAAASVDAPRGERPMLAALCRAMSRIDQPGLGRSIARLAPEAQLVALAASGFDVAQSHFAAQLDAAGTDAERLLILTRAQHILAGPFSRARNGVQLGRAPGPTPSNLSRWVVRCARGAKSADERIADAYVAAARFPEGEDHYPGARVALALLGSEVESGGLVLTDGWQRRFDPRPGPARMGHCRMVGKADAKSGQPGDPWEVETYDEVALDGTTEGDTLLLALTNSTSSSISLDPLALRLAAAAIVEASTPSGASERAPPRILQLSLGPDWSFNASRDASVLVVLSPGSTYRWDLPMRKGDGAAKHIAISITGAFEVRGTPAAPLLTTTTAAWIR